MKINESDIEAIFDKMESKSEMDEKLLSAFANEQPHITTWLLGEDYKVLTEDEQDYLFFLVMVIYEACKSKLGVIKEIEGDMIRETEESMWTLIDGSEGKTFKDRISVFFERSEEEDLLAFAEDSLSDEDGQPDDMITKIGREPMFVALATVIEVCTNP
jgi:hypothetical protein